MEERSSSDAVAILKRSPVFSEVSDSAIASLLPQCRQISRKAGTGLFRAGQEAERFFVVISGRVKVFQLSPRGDEQILHLFDEGQTFGEAAMWAGGNFPAGAEVVKDATLLIVPRSAVRKALADNPDLAMGMLAGLSGKLQEFAALIEQLSLKEVPARLAAVLLRESGKGKLREIRLTQTKRQLAGQIGTVAETLSRTLAKMKAAGIIDVRGSSITILDAQALAEMAETG